MRYAVPDFSLQIIIFLKEKKVGQVSVLAEALD